MTAILKSDAPQAVERTVRCLERGGVVLVPTDTVYGLAASPGNERAVVRLFAIKRRPPSRDLPVMVRSEADLAGLGVAVTEAARRLTASELMPGPLTIVLGFSGARRAPWLEGRDEVAFRIPDDPFMLDLLAAAGPLLVTSANLHGSGTSRTPAEILPGLAFDPDLAIDGGERETVPSTLVNCALEVPTIEREGVVERAVIMDILA